ncbi:hypothetical protein PV396_43470 [Streptomyces sp. ME02-8801-2C]|nr:hypothetical protein [Streptomyces sp. ME02-8801-2C]MDX3458711.1 hypothetical protein [Streptomyces sp. ME02-8801-2C]
MSDTHTVLYDPRGPIEAELPLDRPHRRTPQRHTARGRMLLSIGPTAGD